MIGRGNFRLGPRFSESGPEAFMNAPQGRESRIRDSGSFFPSRRFFDR